MNAGTQAAARSLRLLPGLADPLRAAPDPGEIAGCDAAVLFAAADIHGVEAVVARKLSLAGLCGDRAFAPRLAGAVRNRMFATAIARTLDDQAARIVPALTDAGVRHALVKGAAFAANLYPCAADRPYGDIDILAPPKALAVAMEVLAGLGLRQHRRARFDRSKTNEEYKWSLPGKPLVSVELHTNLVHVAALRRRVSFGYAEYGIAGAGGALPFAGHFAVAAAHAGAGHKFHQLKLLVDVMQAARALGDEELGHLGLVLPRLRLHPEISMALALVDRLFGPVEATGRVRAALRLPPCWTPVGAAAVIDAPAAEAMKLSAGRRWRSKLSRHAFRWYQLALARRPRR